MWPFRNRVDNHEDLTARLERLEREWKAREIEWEEWYDKFRRLYARIAKRVERENTASTADGPRPNGSYESAEASSGINRVQQLNAEILARRRGHRAVPNGQG